MELMEINLISFAVIHITEQFFLLLNNYFYQFFLF